MPALILLGRRWHIAADDLPLPSLIGMLLHVAILVLNSVGLSFVADQLDATCPYRRRQIAFLSSHVILFSINSILHTWIFFESIRGSVFQVHLRSRVAQLVLAVVICYCLTVANNAFGTHLIYMQKPIWECKAHPGRLRLNQIILLEAIVIATWVSLFIGCLAMVITINLFSTYQVASRPWLSRFRLYRVLCFCCWGRCGEHGSDALIKKRSNIDDNSSGRSLSPMVVIANIFTHMFGRVDMTLTDYVAAFTLLGLRHSHSKPAFTYTNARPPSWLLAAAGDIIAYNHGTSMVLGTQGGGCADCQLPMGNNDAILEPPLVAEFLTSGHSTDVTSGGGTSGVLEQSLVPAQFRNCKVSNTTSVLKERAAVMAEQVALQVDSLTTPSLPNITTHPAATTKTFAVPNMMDGGACNTSAKEQTSSTTTTATTTTSIPDVPIAAQANVAEGAGNMTIALADSSTLPTTVASGLSAGNAELTCQRPVSSLCPKEGGDGVNQLEPWDSDNFAPCNAGKEVMQEALHYMRFATAVYGWKMYLWMNRLRVTNCCRLCLGRSCGCCRQSSYFIRAVGPDYGPSEGCCSAIKLLEREAITQLTGVPDDDILYVCYDNRIGGLLPYYVALDRQHRSIVVGIRGSLSLRDVVTDLLCEPAEYHVPGVPNTDDSGRQTLWAHRGILQSTMAILKDIQKQGVVAAAVAEWPAEEVAQQRVLQQLPSERARVVAQRLRGACTGFRVVVTGHSLGAGVTGLLGPLLQKQFPNLRCWAFAPPGGLMSPKAAELTHGICLSLLHAKDMIPRLGVNTMEQLVQDLVNAGVHSRVNKLTIIGRLIMMGERPPLEQIFLPPDVPLSPQMKDVLDRCHSHQDGPSMQVAEQFAGARDFVPPGHMLYVERRKPAGDELPCCSCNVCMLNSSARNAQYVCRWIKVKDLVRTGLVISRSMFLDHLPDNTLYALEMALSQISSGGNHTQVQLGDTGIGSKGRGRAKGNKSVGCSNNSNGGSKTSASKAAPEPAPALMEVGVPAGGSAGITTREEELPV